MRALSDLGMNSWRPAAKASREEGVFACGRESKEFDLDFKGDLAGCRKRARELEKGLGKVRELM